MKSLFSFVLLFVVGRITLLPYRMAAETFTNLYNFTATSSPENRNGDGANPHGTLILSGDTLLESETF
jgi:hypothetical protein